MSLINRIVPLVLAVSLSACINVPEVEGPETPDAGLPDAGFTLNISPSQAAIPQGGAQAFQVSLTRKNGFDGSVSIDLLNPPAGIVAQPVTIPSGSTSATLSINIGEDVAPATRIVTLRGTAAGTLPADASLEITVLRAGDLLVRWGNPTQATVYANSGLSLTASVQGGTADSLEFLKGGTVLAQLTASPYQFTWDTTQEAEGTYQIVARAKRGTSMFTSTVLTVVVDRTAPTFVSRVPLPDATAVSVKTSIEAVFSEPLKAASVTNSSVIVSTGSIPSVEKTVTLSPDGTRLTISPTAPFTAPSAVTISPGSTNEPLTDLAGNAVNSTQPWTFTVPEWLPAGGPLSAVPGATPAENATMKIGLDGNPVVAWSEFDGSSKNVYVARWDGSGWHPLGSALSALPGNTPAEHPAMEIDTSGRPIVVWEEATGSATSESINLFAATWTGVSWEPLPSFPISSDSETYRKKPAITVDSSGTVSIADHRYNGAGYNLEIFQLARPTNSWTRLSPILPSNQFNPADSSVIAPGTGAFYVAYDTYLDNYSTRGIAVANEHWSQLGNSLIVNPASRGGISPQIAINGNGTLYITWQEIPQSQLGDTADGIIYAARWNGSWQYLGISVSTSSTPNVQPCVTTSIDGNPVIAWSESTSTERVIRTSRWTGSSWQMIGPALNALVGTGTDALKPSLANDTNGRLWLAWQESDGSSSNIYAYHINN